MEVGCSRGQGRSELRHQGTDWSSRMHRKSLALAEVRYSALLQYGDSFGTWGTNRNFLVYGPPVSRATLREQAWGLCAADCELVWGGGKVLRSASLQTDTIRWTNQMSLSESWLSVAVCVQITSGRKSLTKRCPNY